MEVTLFVHALLESGTDPTVTDIKQRIERAGFTWAPEHILIVA